MIVPKRGAVVSLVVGLLGLATLFLPWAMFLSGVSPSTTKGQGESAAELIATLFLPPSQAVQQDPAIQNWEIRATPGVGLWIVGTVIFSVGASLVAAEVLTKFRWAGSIMLIGSAMAGSGILSFSGTFPSVSYFAVQYTVAPGYGLVAAVGFSLAAFVPVFLHDASGPPAPGAVQAGHAQLEIHTSGEPHVATEAMQSPLTTPLGPPPWSPVPRFCPSCGRWYYEDYKLCPRDSSELKAVQ